jgi:hypothetical protein
LRCNDDRKHGAQCVAISVGIAYYRESVP